MLGLVLIALAVGCAGGGAIPRSQSAWGTLGAEHWGARPLPTGYLCPNPEATWAMRLVHNLGVLRFERPQQQACAAAVMEVRESSPAVGTSAICGWPYRRLSVIAPPASAELANLLERALVSERPSDSYPADALCEFGHLDLWEATTRAAREPESAAAQAQRRHDLLLQLIYGEAHERHSARDALALRIRRLEERLASAAHTCEGEPTLVARLSVAMIEASALLLSMGDQAFEVHAPLISNEHIADLFDIDRTSTNFGDPRIIRRMSLLSATKTLVAPLCVHQLRVAAVMRASHAVPAAPDSGWNLAAIVSADDGHELSELQARLVRGEPVGHEVLEDAALGLDALATAIDQIILRAQPIAAQVSAAQRAQGRPWLGFAVTMGGLGLIDTDGLRSASDALRAVGADGLPSERRRARAEQIGRLLDVQSTDGRSYSRTVETAMRTVRASLAALFDRTGDATGLAALLGWVAARHAAPLGGSARAYEWFEHFAGVAAQRLQRDLPAILADEAAYRAVAATRDGPTSAALAEFDQSGLCRAALALYPQGAVPAEVMQRCPARLLRSPGSSDSRDSSVPFALLAGLPWRQRRCLASGWQ